MNSFKNYTLLFLVFLLVSCDFGLNHDLDKATAEKLIHEKTENFSKTELELCNAQVVIFKNGDYLFVVNSFKGNFNGYIFSKHDNPDFMKMKFEDFYITNHEKSKDSWTKVYGKW